MYSSQELTQSEAYQVAAFYCFISLDEKVISSLLIHLPEDAQEYQVKGTVLLAKEGINGTAAGVKSAIKSLESFFYHY